MADTDKLQIDWRLKELPGALGAEIVTTLPSELDLPLRAYLRALFRAGVHEAPLARHWIDRAGGLPVGGQALSGVSVVIPVRGAHDWLRGCVDCVVGQPDVDEVIICCQKDEHDAVRDVVGDWPDKVRWVRTEEVQGFAQNCNLGASVALGRVLLFLNSDALVPSGVVRHLVEILDDSPTAVAVGPMGTNVSGAQNAGPHDLPAPPDAEEMARLLRQYILIRPRGAPGPGRYVHTRRLVGFCVAVLRGPFVRVGGFSPEYGLGNWDDDDLSLRLLLAYGPRALARAWGALVVHGGGRSFAELPDAAQRYRELLTENQQTFYRRWGWIKPAIDAWATREGIE